MDSLNYSVPGLLPVPVLTERRVCLGVSQELFFTPLLFLTGFGSCTLQTRSRSR
jgi:hypothetical protein